MDAPQQQVMTVEPGHDEPHFGVTECCAMLEGVSEAILCCPLACVAAQVLGPASCNLPHMKMRFFSITCCLLFPLIEKYSSSNTIIFRNACYVSCGSRLQQKENNGLISSKTTTTIIS